MCACMGRNVCAIDVCVGVRHAALHIGDIASRPPERARQHEASADLASVAVGEQIHRGTFGVLQQTDRELGSAVVLRAGSDVMASAEPERAGRFLAQRARQRTPSGDGGEWRCHYPWISVRNALRQHVQNGPHDIRQQGCARRDRPSCQ